MTTLDFTNNLVAISTISDGYFGYFEDIYTYYPMGFFNLGSLGTSYDPLLDYPDPFYLTKTTDGTLSLASYFNTSSLISAATIWNFSSAPDEVKIGPFYLLDSSASGYGYLGAHGFKNDVFNLGAGSDFFLLQSFGYFDYAPLYTSLVYKTFSDEMLDGGYKVTVNGGSGSDSIELRLELQDYFVDKIGVSSRTKVIPRSIINGNAGNDRITIHGMAGIVNGDTSGNTAATGADIIYTDIFSDFVNGGPGPDVIVASQNFPLSDYGIGAYKEALNQKDLLIGGTGRDNFVIDFLGAYGLNGFNDFAVITDFEFGDRISTVYSRGDLLIDTTPGSLALGAKNTYSARTVNYNSRILLDSDGSGTINDGDELLMYVAGSYQPIAGDIFYGL